MKTVKLTIAELRKEKGVTQAELADYIGVSFQSVSKWENGTNMPDITLLPLLAEFFQVSVDEILGLKPLKNNDYISRKSDSREFWNNKLEYTKNTHFDFWNEDYLEFLVSKVWKITEPINIIHFGCRYGHLGMLLLPLLPKGSTYTGVDISDQSIAEAKLLFKNSEFETEFVNSDWNTYNVEKQYDMAICQTLLRHMPNPRDILNKMVQSVRLGGRVVCIDVNREFESAGLYIKGIDYNSMGRSIALQKLWEAELIGEGRDHAIGMKIPLYMQECGLENIDVRINDKVKLMNPSGDKQQYDKLVDAWIKANEWENPLSDSKKETMIELFMNRGATRAEVETYIKSQNKIRNYVMNNKEDIFALNALCLLISYGTKVSE